MPGIAGIITKKPAPWAEQRVSRMLATQRHESFYTCGTWKDESLGIYVGWTALQSSFAAEMPLVNECGDVTLVFSGEEYPESGTAERLSRQGHSLHPQNASYLVHLYEDDPNFIANLNGMFHGLLVDRTRGTALLFNDRFGMHRVYYHESKDAFYFAAEAKSILAVWEQPRTADPQSLGEFVALSCVLENRTLFKGIHALPAASAWSFRAGALERKNTYFQASEWEQQPPLEGESYFQELRDVLRTNLPRYFAGRERIGIALTGGLDTRALLSTQKFAPQSVPCYTFGGAFRECRDVVVARRVARTCKQRHEVITVGDEFLSRFPHYAERTVYLTEGGVDLYRATDLYLSEKARLIAPAKVVGTYGSEILQQAVMFKPAGSAAGFVSLELLPYVRQAEDTYHRIRRMHPVSFVAFCQSPWYHRGILSLEQTQLTVRSPYLDNDFVRTVFRAPRSAPTGADVRLRLIAEGNPALGQIPTDRGVGGESGLYSTFARKFLEFTFKAEYAYDYGMPQFVAKVDSMLAPLRLERLFLGRHKFSHYRVWYRDALSEYIRQMLLDARTLSRPYLNRKAVEAAVRGHLGGSQNNTTVIHKLLALELIQRSFLDAR